MNLIDIILFERFERKPKSFLDAIKEALTMPKALKQQKALYKEMCRMCEDGVDADEMPDGKGEFGMTPSNPIPCKTIFGSKAYLARLRTPNNLSVAYTRSGSFGSEASPHPVDAIKFVTSTESTWQRFSFLRTKSAYRAKHRKVFFYLTHHSANNSSN